MQKMYNENPPDFGALTERETQLFQLGCSAGFETARRVVLGRILTVQADAIHRRNTEVITLLDNLANDIEQSWRE